MEDYDYSFSQNGLVAYKAGQLIAEQVRACCIISLVWKPESYEPSRLVCVGRTGGPRLRRRGMSSGHGS